MPVPPKPLPVHVTEPLLVAAHANICAEYFHAWAADLKRRLKASEGGGGIEPSRHLQLCAGVADELRKACQRVERVLRGGVDAMNTSTIDATKNVVEDVLRYMYRVADDDPHKPTECCVCDAAPLDGINVCSKHAALARQTMFYLLGAANEAMGYTEDVTPGKRMRCDFPVFPDGCARHAIALIDDDASGRRFVRCGEHSLDLLGTIANAEAPAPTSHHDFSEPMECAHCSEPITSEAPWRAESDWWHRACYDAHRAAKDKVVPLKGADPGAVELCPKCGRRALPAAPRTEVDPVLADAEGIAPGVYHLGCLQMAREAAAPNLTRQAQLEGAYETPTPTVDVCARCGVGVLPGRPMSVRESKWWHDECYLAASTDATADITAPLVGPEPTGYQAPPAPLTP